MSYLIHKLFSYLSKINMAKILLYIFNNYSIDNIVTISFKITIRTIQALVNSLIKDDNNDGRFKGKRKKIKL